MRCRLKAAGPLLALVAVAPFGCAPADPRQEILDERARWSVTPKGFVQSEDGQINVSVTVSGPARSTLRQLTVRIEAQDAASRIVAQEWRTLDLTRVPLGAAMDFSLRIPEPTEPFEGIRVDTVLDPTPEEAGHIRELQL